MPKVQPPSVFASAVMNRTVSAPSRNTDRNASAPTAQSVSFASASSALPAMKVFHDFGSCLSISQPLT
jgi:hypothetical protein